MLTAAELACMDPQQSKAALGSGSFPGLVAQIGDQAEDPFSRCLSGDGLDLGSSEGLGAVHDGEADVDLGGLTIRVRSQINAACPKALCCRLVPLVPSYDRCAKRPLRSSTPMSSRSTDDLWRRDGALWTPPRAIRIQTIRAILFASATRTSIDGLRGSIPPSRVPGLAAAWTWRLMTKLLAPMIRRLRKDRSPTDAIRAHLGEFGLVAPKSLLHVMGGLPEAGERAEVTGCGTFCREGPPGTAIALANRMASNVWALLRNGTEYDATRAA